MCTRWMQIGAFNTFYRNHNGFGTKVRRKRIFIIFYVNKCINFFYTTKEQDPAALGKDVAEASRIVTETRYSLLPYLYSLFYQVHKNGGTVIRSLMQEYVKACLKTEKKLYTNLMLISQIPDRSSCAGHLQAVHVGLVAADQPGAGP